MTRFKQHKELPIKYIQHKLKEFFNEDDIDNDLTTQLIFSSEKETEAVFIAKEIIVKICFKINKIYKLYFPN